ncbi:MAG: DUF2442 domain-containing protein [Moorellales bacterium]
MCKDGAEVALHEIRSVYPVGSHHLILEFETGQYRVADVRPFLEGPRFEPLKDPAFFRQVKADPETRTVVWPNGAGLCPDVPYAKARLLGCPRNWARRRRSAQRILAAAGRNHGAAALVLVTRLYHAEVRSTTASY